MDRQARAAVLCTFGAVEADLDALLDYTNNIFDHSCLPLTLPPPAEPHVASWQAYADAARINGVWPTLREHLVQLCFPVRAGISETEVYRLATRNGQIPKRLPQEGLHLQNPGGLQMHIHSTAAGPLPVVVISERADFVTLVQALCRRNEPVPVPDAMGACIVTGYNNWSRVAELRRQWEAAQRSNEPTDTWSAHLARTRERKELYQDRFVLLSRGSYSNVAAAELGLDKATWQEWSLRIRLEHECTHYFTWRLLGSMRTRLLDELMADYAGIVAVRGHFAARDFLRFMGLDAGPVCRPSGRFENYRGQLSLQPQALVALGALVIAAAYHLEELDHLYRAGNVVPMLLALSRLTLEALAAPDYQEHFVLAQAAAPQYLS